MSNSKGEHPIIATDLFLYTSGVSELDFNDFVCVGHVADGGCGSVYKFSRKADPMSLVAMKFFGMKGCQRPDTRAIEEEITTDWKMNSIKSTAECYGYIIDSFEGYASYWERPDLRNPGQFVRGKAYKGRFLVKVSECLEMDIMGMLMEEVSFTYRACSTLFRNLIVALAECHNNNLIHRDLKPENFMFVKTNILEDTDEGEKEADSFKGKTLERRSSRRTSIDINTDLKVKLIDFGASAYLPVGKDQLEYNGPPKGTCLYYAPETLQNRVHSKATDIWQAACTLWVIMFTEYPFKHNTVHDLEVYNKTRRVVPNPHFNVHDLEFPEHKINITENCKDLFRRMFEIEPAKRITCAEILNHSWVRDFASLDDIDFGEEYRKGLREFKHLERLRKSIESQVTRRNRIKQSILQTIGVSTNITTTQNTQLKSLFLKAIGYDGKSPINIHDGVDCSTFCSMLEQVGLKQFATERIFNLFDIDDNNSVDYFEFFSALSSFREITSISSKLDSMENRIEVEKEENCRFYFEIFDYDGTDRISRNEFHAVIAQLMLDYEGVQFNDVLITDVFSLVDLDRTGFINFTEFRAWFDYIFDTTQSMGLTRLSSQGSRSNESIPDTEYLTQPSSPVRK